jgi:hypothetical protein
MAEPCWSSAMTAPRCRPVAGGDFAKPPRHGAGVNDGVRSTIPHRTVWLAGCTLVVLVGLGVAAVRTPVDLAILSAAFGTVGGPWLWAVASRHIRLRGRLGAWSRAIRYAGAKWCVTLQPRPKLSKLTDEQLCTQWHDSYLPLQGPVSPGKAIGIVQQRQRCLDELERRHPFGLRAWLASGAWASSTPLPYLTERCSADSIFNWDQLTREQDR